MPKRGNGLSRSVSIVGVGCSPFGFVLETPEIKNMTERELTAWAVMEALEDAGLEPKDIDAAYVGHCMSETLSHQYASYAMISDWIGMRNKPIHAHDEACSSSNAGLAHAVTAVASGLYDFVLSAAVEITSSVPVVGQPACNRQALAAPDLWYPTNYGADQAYWFPSAFAVSYLMEFPAMAYGKKYGLTMDQIEQTLNAASRNDRRAAVLNPLAAWTTKSFEQEAQERGFQDLDSYMKSPYNAFIGAFYRVFHGANPVDGASALIVCPTDVAKKLVDTPVEVLGFGTAVGVPYHGVQANWDTEAAAFAQAYSMAGINPSRDLDYAYLHDCLCCAHFVSAEAAGYFAPGEAWQAVIDGRTAFDGDKPINATGGRPWMGHAWAASAGAEIYEAVKQMRGLSGARQIKKRPETAAIHTIGHGVHIHVSVLSAVS